MELSDAFLPIITLITAQITVLDLAKFRFKSKKVLLILMIELIVQAAVNAPILIFAGLEQYARFYFFTMDIPAILTFCYIAKWRDFRDLYTVLITIFISFCISVPAMWISKLFHSNYTIYNLMRIMTFIVIFLLLHFVLRKYYIQLQEEMGEGWGMFCILPFIGSVYLYYQFWQYSIDGDFTELLIDCSTIILIMTPVFIVFFYIFIQLHEKYIVQEQKRILDLQNKAQQAQFEQHREATEKINRRWHDMRHNTQQLIGLLEAGDTEAALTYLKEQRGVEEVPKEEYCLHPAVNSILCLWAERSRQAGILVDINTDVPEKLEIEPMELSALFANAFENAYDGCICLADNRQKYIKINTHYNGKRLAIGISNSCLQDIQFEEGLPVSSKSGGGIGTRSMIYTVRRFRGTAFFEAKEGVFTARFILNI